MPARKVTYILSVTVPVVVVGVGIFKLHQPSHPHDPQILNTLEKPSTLPQQQKMSELPSRPVSLHIPSLKVTASVEPKGLNNLGEMDVPQKGDSISWYKFGYLPGALGNAVF